jgi:hypothetical protein
MPALGTALSVASRASVYADAVGYTSVFGPTVIATTWSPPQIHLSLLAADGRFPQLNCTTGASVVHALYKVHKQSDPLEAPML